MVLAVLCQFLVLFPFLVMSEGIGFGEFVWWHYAAMYAAAAGFWAVGRLLRGWASGAGLSKRGRGWAGFLSRVGFVAPGAAFCVVCGLMELHSGLYLYLLPGCIAAYYGRAPSRSAGTTARCSPAGGSGCISSRRLSRRCF